METIVITGANRGIGLEFVKQYAKTGARVLACCRQLEQAIELVGLSQQHDNVSVHAVDVNDSEQINAFIQQLAQMPIDILINNAGIAGGRRVNASEWKADDFLHIIQTNTFAPLKFSGALLPNLKASQRKLVVNISSKVGSISDNTSGCNYAYRSSKAALNCVMRSFAIDHEQDGIKVMLLHPGWVKTSMGGPKALIDEQESVTGMRKQIELHGSQSHADVLLAFDGQRIPW